MDRTTDLRRPLSGADPSPDDRRPFSWTALGLFAGVTLFAYYLWLWLVQGKPVGGMILLGPLLVMATAPFLIRATRQTPAFDLGGVFLCGLVLRFAFTYYRFVHATDAWGYHVDGERLATFYRHFDFSAPTNGSVPGTGGMNAISAGVEILVNSDFFATFVITTFLSFIGCWLLYRAFETAVPDGDHYRYALLIMLMPSMCFWPSSLGKDAWMVFTVGVAAYGAARVLTRRVGGYTLLAIGLFAASFVRPHLALLTIIAFLTALLVGRRDTGQRKTITPSFLAKIVGLALVLVIGSVLISRTQRLLDINDFSSASLDKASASVTDRTSEGNATYNAANPRSPFGFAEATVTVLFRPFPIEAHGTEQLASAFEGVFLIVFTAASFRRLMTIPRRLRAQPYVMFALSFVLLWILVFGIIANFGILARQRTQMYPFFFVLLSVAAVVAKPQSTDVDAVPAAQQPLR